MKPAEPPVPRRVSGVKVAPSIPNEEAVVCHTRFYVVSTGRLVDKGTVLTKDNPIAQAHPEFFHTAAQALQGAE